MSDAAIKIALIEPEPLHTAWIDKLIRLGGVPTARTTPNEADVILLGLETFGCSEMDFIESLHAIFPFTPIVILSGTDPRLWTGEAVRLGAKHVLEKDDLTSDRLASAIRFYGAIHVDSVRDLLRPDAPGNGRDYPQYATIGG